MIVLVCGGREFDDWPLLRKTLDEIHQETVIDRVIHGGSRGADKLAGNWASDRNVLATAYNADWRREGLRAGPIRNSLMIEQGKPDLVIAFQGGSGTTDMVKKATKSGIKVRVVQ